MLPDKPAPAEVEPALLLVVVQPGHLVGVDREVNVVERDLGDLCRRDLDVAIVVLQLDHDAVEDVLFLVAQQRLGRADLVAL